MNIGRGNFYYIYKVKTRGSENKEEKYKMMFLELQDKDS